MKIENGVLIKVAKKDIKNGRFYSEEVEKVGCSAFEDCADLTSISLPKATEIECDGFYNCTQLVNVNLPLVTEIGVAAFGGCVSLTSISLPKLIKIPGFAFHNCNDLVDVELPQVREVNSYAFSSCTRLATLSLAQARKIGSGVFKNCSALNTITISHKVLIMADTFLECNNLQRIIINDSTNLNDVYKLREQLPDHLKCIEIIPKEKEENSFMPIAKCLREINGINPKDIHGLKKVPLDLVPDTGVIHAAMAFQEGATKYGAYNWRSNPINKSIYIAAARRHISQYWNGETLDVESNVHNLGCAVACLMILLDAEAVGNLVDDGPVAAPITQLMKQVLANKSAK